MTLLNKPDQTRVREHLARELVAPVHLLTYIDSPTCKSCDATVSLLQEVARLSDRVRVEVVERAAAPERAASFGVDKTPAIVALAGADGELRDTRMRFFGVPSGYELVSLIEAIVAASRGAPRLAPATQAFLDRLDRPLHLQVFVTPSCPTAPAPWPWCTAWLWPARRCAPTWSRSSSSRTWPTATTSTVSRAR